jgi:hypothetical protein
MSKRSQDKRRARAKEKKLAKRRLQGTSPLARLAGRAEETCECWLTQSEDERMVSLEVMRPARGGQTVAAFFLIDRDCVGVKDAFCRLDVDPVELRAFLRERGAAGDAQVARVDLSVARKMVAGAIRWTRAHPFRLPRDLDRCLRIMDGVGDIENADISDFGDEDGNLLYVGRQVDLEKCLAGVTLEEFLEREDVECIFHQGNETFGWAGDSEEDEEGWGDEEMDLDEEEVEEEEEEVFEAMEAQAANMERKLLDGVRRWCFAKARAPHPKLEAAVGTVLHAMMAGLLGENEEAGLQLSILALKAAMASKSEEEKAGMEEAMAQVEEYEKSFGSREEFFEAIGFADPGN